MATTWSSTDRNARTVVSNGGLTISSDASGDGIDETGRASAGVGSSDKRYWEIHYDAEGGATSTGFGTANGARSLADSYWLGNDPGDLSLYNDGNCYNGGAPVVTLSPFSVGDTICWAFDGVNKRAWVRVNNGNWNGSGTADPATNTGGIDTSLFGTPPMYPAYNVANHGTQGAQTANFGATSFTYTVPSGFSGFDSPGFTPTPGTFGYDLFGEEYYSARLQDQNVGPIVIAASSLAEFGQVIHTAGMHIANVGSSMVATASQRFRTAALHVIATAVCMFSGQKLWEKDTPTSQNWIKPTPGPDPWTPNDAGDDPWKPSI